MPNPSAELLGFHASIFSRRSWLAFQIYFFPTAGRHNDHNAEQQLHDDRDTDCMRFVIDIFVFAAADTAAIACKSPFP